jgi:5-methylcytosine-specific restriction endonuclease McrA
MPNRAPRACQPGCPNLRGSCPDHPVARWSAGARGRRMPPGWDATRARVLARDHHRCRQCGAPASEAHHTEPGNEDEATIIALCEACHARITAAQAAEARRMSRP